MGFCWVSQNVEVFPFLFDYGFCILFIPYAFGRGVRWWAERVKIRRLALARVIRWVEGGALRSLPHNKCPWLSHRLGWGVPAGRPEPLRREPNNWRKEPSYPEGSFGWLRSRRGDQSGSGRFVCRVCFVSSDGLSIVSRSHHRQSEVMSLRWRIVLWQVVPSSPPRSSFSTCCDSDVSRDRVALDFQSPAKCAQDDGHVGAALRCLSRRPSLVELRSGLGPLGPGDQTCSSG